MIVPAPAARILRKDPLSSPPNPLDLTLFIQHLASISAFVSYVQEKSITMPDEILILLGTHDDYIHSALFDTVTKGIRLGRSTRTEPHPSWLTRHPSVCQQETVDNTDCQTHT